MISRRRGVERGCFERSGWKCRSSVGRGGRAVVSRATMGELGRALSARELLANTTC